MSKYSGFECIACGKKFTDEDDVVVCPECGTPYHRECYIENGKCINEELHKSGESWLQEKNVNMEGIISGGSGDAGENEDKRCPRCGYENTPEKLFCEKCGMPLITPENSVPFNDSPNNQQNNFQQNNQGMGSNFEGTPLEGQAVYNQDSEIDGVRLGDYARYVGVNPMPFLARFIKFGKYGGKISMNVFAFLFPHLYFFYRKMNKWGVLFMVIYALLTIPTMVVMFAGGYAGIKMSFAFDTASKGFLALVSASSDIMLLMQIVAGIFANFIYYKQARRDIMSVYQSQQTENPDSVRDILMKKGGISWPGVIVGFTVSMVITCVGTFVLTLIK